MLQDPSPPPEKTPASKAEIALRRILRSAPQDLWLDTIRRTKGPQHDGLVHWMLGQAECDFAVAVHALYRSDPIKHLASGKTLPARPGHHDIFAQILLNWDTGSYRAHRLRVQTVDAHPSQIARLKEAVAAQKQSTLPFAIPQQFLDPRGGKTLRLLKGQSPDDAPQLWKIYQALGLDVLSSPPGVGRVFAMLSAARDRLGLTSGSRR